MNKFELQDKVISVKNTQTTQEGYIGFITEILGEPWPYLVTDGEGREEIFGEDELELLSVGKTLGQFVASELHPSVTYRREIKPEVNKEEHTGGSVDYYKVYVANPTTLEQPYYAEANDIIESLGLTFAEGNLLKAVWRIAADRNGKKKKGNNSVYDAEKLVFFAERVLAQEKGK